MLITWKNVLKSDALIIWDMKKINHMLRSNYSSAHAFIKYVCIYYIHERREEQPGQEDLKNKMCA